NLAELALWAVPGLLALACIGAVWRRSEPAVRLLTASALLTAVAYVFVPYDQGHGWGYRYFHAAWGALPLLVAGALEHPRAVAPLRKTALIGALASLLLGNGLRLGQVRSFIDSQLRQIPSAPAPARLEVVFLRPDRGYYTVDLVQNDPFLDGRDLRLARRRALHDDDARARRCAHGRGQVRLRERDSGRPGRVRCLARRKHDGGRAVAQAAGQDGSRSRVVRHLRRDDHGGRQGRRHERTGRSGGRSSRIARVF